MKEEFKYLKEGLATDLVDYLIHDYKLDLREAFNVLYESQTYANICNPLTGLYFQGSRYVYTYLQDELENGKVRM